MVPFILHDQYHVCWWHGSTRIYSSNSYGIHSVYQTILASATGGCFTNVSRSLQYILSKFSFCRYHTFHENFTLKRTCAQNHALGTGTKFQHEILSINVICGIVYFREIIFESSRNISETTLWTTTLTTLFIANCIKGQKWIRLQIIKK